MQPFGLRVLSFSSNPHPQDNKYGHVTRGIVLSSRYKTSLYHRFTDLTTHLPHLSLY